MINSGLLDISNGSRKLAIAGMLGWQDVKQRYRRSVLGPFWLTLSMGIMVAALAFLFSGIFNVEISEFLPSLSIGLVFWAYVASIVNEGCITFTGAEAMIKQLPLPRFTYVLRVIWRNFIVLLHNSLIIVVVYLILQRNLEWSAWLSIPGLLLATLNATWMALILGIVCARYRDMTQIVASLLNVVFYMTPIMWLPSLLSGQRRFYLLELNPFNHLLEIVRSPLLGTLPSNLSWLVCAAMAIIGWMLALAVYSKYVHRLSFWL
jgi:ABC-type polysaccharide/polyol phosphate export permease